MGGGGKLGAEVRFDGRSVQGYTLLGSSRLRPSWSIYVGKEFVVVLILSGGRESSRTREILFLTRSLPTTNRSRVTVSCAPILSRPSLCVLVSGDGCGPRPSSRYRPFCGRRRVGRWSGRGGRTGRRPKQSRGVGRRFLRPFQRYTRNKGVICVVISSNVVGILRS